MALKNLFRLVFIFLIFNLSNFNDSDYVINKEKVEDIITDKIKMKNYEAYLYIPKFEYKGLIKTGESKKVLDSNNILLLENGSKIDDEFGNLVLAGHNNRYVFSNLYKLDINDKVIIYEENYKYIFEIYEKYIVEITDTYILDNVYDRKIVTLITCTNNNQKRLVLRGVLKSHNFP